jgi:PAS domain S-box-containing protein
MPRAHSPALSDPARIAALHAASLQIPGCDTFGNLTRIAMRVLHVPVCLVTFVDAEHEYVESGTGLPEPWATTGIIPLEISICRHVVERGRPVLIKDTRTSRLTRRNRHVFEAGVVAYAGVPVRTHEGLVLGAVCVMDTLPRTWRPDEVEVLSELTHTVEHEIGQRRSRRAEREESDAAAAGFREELTASAQFRTLVENSLAGIYLVRGDRVLYANPRLRQIFGYDADDDLGDLRIPDLVAEPDRARVAERLLAPEGGGYAFTGIRKDGAPVDVEVLGSTVEDGGRPVIVGTLLDVTEQRRAEEALRATAERMRLVQRATDDVIWEWDIRTGDIAWNDAGPRMFRYKPGEVGGTIGWHQEHLHPDDREEVMRSLQHVLGGVGEFWSHEYRFRRGDGQYATVLDRACIVRDDRGDPLRLIGTMLDVTERKRDEEAQRFLSQASALLDSSLDLDSLLPRLARMSVPYLGDYCLIDLAEGERSSRRVAAAHTDPAAEHRLLPPEIISAAAREVMRTGRPVFVPECDDLRLGALGYSEAERAVLGGEHSCSLMIVPLLVGERRAGTLTVGRADAVRPYSPVDLLLLADLAHRTALAVDHSQLYEQAMRAIQARDEVLAVVSHDLRNPLGTIQMSAAILAEMGQDRRSENQRWLDTIHRTVERMNVQLNDLLDASSIDAGRFSVSPTEQSVAELMDEARGFLRPLAAEKGLTLRCTVAGPLPPAPLDSAQLLRVLSNLAGNAIKFTPAGGTVTVRAELADEMIRFSVSDTGPGIPAEQLPHVFDRYWQGRTGDRRGAGLGLAIAKGIVEAHGGRLSVESAAGRGTTFTFTVPLGPGSAQEAA